MSGLFGGGGTITQTEQVIAGIQIQTSAYGMVVPLVYGRTRVAVNLIWYGDFKPVPHTTTQNAGKGGGTTMVNTTYTYTAAIMMALCEGPITKVEKWWRDKDEFTAPEPWTVGLGAPAQSPWGYLTTYHPDEAVGYGSTAYVADSQVDLGSSGATKNHSFEVWALYCTGPYGDASPADVLWDFCSDPVHGVGFSLIDASALSNYRACCRAAGCWLSLALTEQRPAAEWLGDIMQATNSAPVWSGGTLKVIPYFDTAQSSPYGSWTPNTTPIYDLGPGDFIVEGAEDPVRVVRSTQADAYNRVQVEFLNRDHQYNIEIAEASDQANIETYGLRTMDPIKLHGICDPAQARNAAQWILQRKLYIRNVYEFDLGPRHMLLDPMDLVRITEPRYGLSGVPVRIIEIEEDEAGRLSVRAEEWPFGVASPTQYPSPSATSGGPNTQVDPGDTQTPVVFEPPADLTNGQHEVWIAACGGANWGGCEVWASRDGSTYSIVGTIVNPARMGTISAGIGADSVAVHDGTGSDITNTLGVNLTVSGGTLISASSADAAAFETLCFVDGEILSYKNALLTAASQYSLSVLRRGLFGSSGAAHAPGGPFARLDDAVLKLPVDRWNLGDTISFKLVSFNAYGQCKQDPSTVMAHAYVLSGFQLGFQAPTAATMTFNSTMPV